jgi:hypothetical protein
MLCSHSSKQGFFGSENLNSGSGIFSKIDEGTSMRDKFGSDEFSDHDGKVGGDGVHSGTEVVREGVSVFGEVEDLLGEIFDEGFISVGDFGTHGDFGGLLDFGFDVFGEEFGEVGLGGLVSHT